MLKAATSLKRLVAQTLENAKYAKQGKKNSPKDRINVSYCTAGGEG